MKNDSEESLKLFINFCNSYAADNKMKSSIKFTVDYSKSEVVSLNTKVKFTDDKVATTLFCMPSASHQYLHRSSYHPTHVFSSIPKSQFIRIRRICTNVTDYWDNASKFVAYFQSRGFSVRSLNKIVCQVAETSQTSLSEKNSIPQVLEMPENNCVPFVVTWHHKLSALPKILHRNYETMVKKFPELKCIFPQPPVVAFHHNRNLKNLLIRSSFTKKFGKPHQPSTPCHSKQCKLCPTMSHSDTSTNSISGKTCTTTGSTFKTPDVIYAAECTFHNKLYIGHTSQPLNMHFNGHRSDAKIKPTACELVHNFHHNTCDFNKDLRVYILQDNVTGPKYQ